MIKRFRFEIALALLGALFLWARISGDLLAQLVLGLLLVVAAVVVVVRWSRAGLRSLLWRLRNRLIVAYIFISLIPILLVTLLTVYGAKYLGGQVAVYLVNAEIERRVEALQGAARALARLPGERPSALRDRIGAFLEARFPNLEIIIEGSGSPGPDAPPAAWGDAGGVVAREQRLYLWGRAAGPESRVTLVLPITRRWLAELHPGLGSVSIIHFPLPGERRVTMLPHPAAGEGEPALPPPVNRLDFEVLWALAAPVSVWEEAGRTERALLGVRSRLSAVLRVLFALKGEGEAPLAALLWFLLVALAAVELASVYIGVSVTRSITGAVHDLYEGTERVRAGDFTHRIAVRGEDQIADLAGSFNRMTGHVERLLQVAKEKERIEAEIEIARQVQAQLFPRSAPRFPHLQLTACCHPARMVSGDYYDYQPIGAGRLAIALGDVAGKGISAALLMASLQTCFRMQVSDLDSANGQDPVSTAGMAARLNAQLYANTAPEKYATFCLGIYDDATGELVYTNAGHLPPLLIRSGKATPLDVNGMVVGAFPSAPYAESRLVLEAGDLLVCYTDGVTEPENEFGVMFGEQRFTDILLKMAQRPNHEIIEEVVAAVRGFTGSPELQDDFTLVLARRV